MITPTFEIKIAVVGHVSVGKTTVLNALLREKYGEVSMRRTTAGINHFRLFSKKDQQHEEMQQELKESPSDVYSVIEGDKDDVPINAKGWSIANDRCIRPAASTLREITADNAKLRNSNEIHEKIFDVELDELFCDMRKDAALVLVDIPGINEAGSGSKYKEYVERKWDTFDCVVLVMDGRQGVNTVEQIDLLEFAKKLLKEKKELPVIILCNKVDDPDDEAQNSLVQETRQEVERVFAVSNRGVALAAMLQAANNKTRGPSEDLIFPVFIPTSAMHAFIYQTASLMSMEQFKKFDDDLIEKVGRDEVGKWTWKKLTEEQRYEVAHRAVSDPSQYIERLEATNFDKFLTSLNYVVGDSQNQLRLIRKQLIVSMNYLAPTRGITKQLTAIYEKAKLLGEPTDALHQAFWDTYEKFEDEAFKRFAQPDDVHYLADPMSELQDYYKLACEIHGMQEKQKSVFRMKTLVRRQFCVIFNMEHLHRAILWNWRKCDVLSWKSLSPEDWKTICRSLLLLSCYKSFCSEFGQEKVWIESLVDKITRTAHCYLCGRPYSLCARKSPQEESPGSGAELDAPTPFSLRSASSPLGAPEQSYLNKAPFLSKAKSRKLRAKKPYADSATQFGLSLETPTPFYAFPAARSAADAIKTVNKNEVVFAGAGRVDEFAGLIAVDLTGGLKNSGGESAPPTALQQLASCECGNSNAVFGGFAMQDGELAPLIAEKFGRIFQVKVPESFANPYHWGHLAWKYCQFAESLERESV